LPSRLKVPGSNPGGVAYAIKSLASCGSRPAQKFAGCWETCDFCSENDVASGRVRVRGFEPGIFRRPFDHTSRYGRRARLDQAIALYDPAAHRSLATRFGQDVGVRILTFRSMALWMLGYPEAALKDSDAALKHARATGQAATLMYALVNNTATYGLCGNHRAVASHAERAVRTGLNLVEAVATRRGDGQAVACRRDDLGTIE